MAKYSYFHTGGHSVFILHAYLVFVTKYWYPMFIAAHQERIKQIMWGVSADTGCELAEFHSEVGHVHMLVNFPPAVAVSGLVNILKGVFSRRLRQEFPDPRSHY